MSLDPKASRLCALAHRANEQRCVAFAALSFICSSTLETDSQAKKDVAAELSWNPAINATKIGADVTNAIVTPSGTVGTYPEKWAAKKVTQRVVGVTGLAVEIEVALDNSALRTDVDIARRRGDIAHRDPTHCFFQRSNGPRVRFRRQQ
jgi:hypothetical protein